MNEERFDNTIWIMMLSFYWENVALCELPLRDDILNTTPAGYEIEIIDPAEGQTINPRAVNS